MYDSAQGGSDTLIGGNNSGSGHVNNFLTGDALSMYDSAQGGDDTLIAGTQSGSGSVINKMWGDAQSMSGSATGGKDTFVFHGDVGTQNYIYDFNQSQLDKIEFSGVTGVTSFSDVTVVQNGSDTVITAAADQVTLVNYDDTTHPLTASDFLFA